MLQSSKSSKSSKAAAAVRALRPSALLRWRTVRKRTVGVLVFARDLAGDSPTGNRRDAACFQGRLIRQQTKNIKSKNIGSVMAIWYYAREGERQGPHSVEEMKRFAANGRLGLDDLVWTEGMPDWTTAAAVKDLFPDTPALSRPPPMPAMAAQASYAEPDMDESAEPLQLWNPNAAANWSLLFSPAFGAWVHAKNWQALNRSDKARTSMVWAYLGLALLGVAIFVPDRTARSISIGFLVGWYFSSAREQVKYVKGELNGIYQKRGWGKPLGLALLALIAYAIVVTATLPLVDPDGNDQSAISTERPL